MADTDSTADDRDGSTEPTDYEPPTESDGRETVTLALDGSEVSLSIPAAADNSEAAAIASAVGAHFHDRQVAAAAAAAEDDGPETVDAWKLASRMKSVGRRRWPKTVRRGEEWKASGRAHY